MMRRRGGPGIMSTMARTAVVAGTATAASNKVNQRGAARAAAAQQAPAAQQAASPPNDLAEKQEQLTALQAQQGKNSALGESGTMMAHLTQLTELRQAGMLTEEEFAAAKARLLAG